MAEAIGRRKKLEKAKVDKTTNASLWLDKYIAAHKDNNAKKDLVNEVATKIDQPEAYKKFYKRWEEMLKKKCSVPAKSAEVKGRMAIGLGAEGVLETSITLHHTYGVPYIPGSALKGLAAHYARNYLEDTWEKDQEAYEELFGSTKKSGCVDFYDALYIPDSGHDKQALWSDIITVHHPNYYQGKDEAPADWDSPTPIPFLSATGKYLIALDGPEAWVNTAYEILAHALWQLGIGAKTSSGYGRMLLDGYEPPKVKPISKEPPKPKLDGLPEYKGVISKFYANSGKGKVRDIKTEKTYGFHRSVIRGGNDLPRKQKVYFKINEETGEVLEVRKRFG